MSSNSNHTPHDVAETPEERAKREAWDDVDEEPDVSGQSGTDAWHDLPPHQMTAEQLILDLAVCDLDDGGFGGRSERAMLGYYIEKAQEIVRREGL